MRLLIVDMMLSIMAPAKSYSALWFFLGSFFTTEGGLILSSSHLSMAVSRFLK